MKSYFALREVDSFKSSKECLWNLAAHENADIIVLGYVGRKGVNTDPAIVSTAIQYASLNSTLPVLIYKDPRSRLNRADKSLNYCVCFDSS